MHNHDVEALEAQLEDLIALVDALADDDFSRPTRCPGWTVAELVAHCEGILVRLVGENAQPVDGAAQIDRVGYYRYDPDGLRDGDDSGRTFSEVVRDRVIEEVDGRSAGQLKHALRAAVDGARRGIADVPADRVIQRSGHRPIAFGEFVASRSVEFGVHTMDIAHATGRPERVQPAAAAIVTGILDGLLGERLPESLRWDTTEYILTGTGRRGLSRVERAELGSLAGRFPLLR